MPSTKRRINLTISDELYDRIQDYKTRFGISNDAGACLQLIVQQLNNLEQAEAMIKFINSSTLEQLSEISNEGFQAIKQANSEKAQPR